MFNCIESDALMDVCRALGLPIVWYSTNSEPDIYIVEATWIEIYKEGGSMQAFKLSDYLLAMAPVDMKEA